MMICIQLLSLKIKIDHLESMVDEASEIFSVRGRGDSGLNNQEINQLEVHISSYLTENDSLKDKISKLSNEISLIDACLEEYRMFHVKHLIYKELNYVKGKKIILLKVVYILI